MPDTRPLTASWPSGYGPSDTATCWTTGFPPGPLPVAAASHLVHTLAMGAGLGDADQAACVKPLEQAAGVEARGTSA
jgi:hypothetical protein